MIQKIRAQSIIEYALLATLVIIGVIVMGPLLIRSINAHFKLWQEPIEDAIHDPMVQKIKPNTPLVGGCQCSDFQPGACGGHFQRSSQSCPSSQRYYAKHCSPPDCLFGSGFQEECRDDAECCNNFIFCSKVFNTNDPRGHGCCGRVPLPTNNGIVLHRPITSNLNGLDPVPNPTNPNDFQTYCYYGEEAIIRNCADLEHIDPTRDVRCMPIPRNSTYPDEGMCDAKCINLPLGNPVICPDTDDPQFLPQDIPWTLLSSDVHNPNSICPNYTSTPLAQRCIAHCSAGESFPDPTNNRCVTGPVCACNDTTCQTYIDLRSAPTSRDTHVYANACSHVPLGVTGVWGASNGNPTEVFCSGDYCQMAAPSWAPDDQIFGFGFLYAFPANPLAKCMAIGSVNQAGLCCASTPNWQLPPQEGGEPGFSNCVNHRHQPMYGSVISVYDYRGDEGPQGCNISCSGPNGAQIR